MNEYSIAPDDINRFLEETGTSPIKQKMKLIELAKRPQVNLFELMEEVPGLKQIYTNCGSRGNEILRRQR